MHMQSSLRRRNTYHSKQIFTGLMSGVPLLDVYILVVAERPFVKGRCP